MIIVGLVQVSSARRDFPALLSTQFKYELNHHMINRRVRTKCIISDAVNISDYFFLFLERVVRTGCAFGFVFCFDVLGF
jgi:hypothetical protein